jgi:hypothetical protein
MERFIIGRNKFWIQRDRSGCRGRRDGTPTAENLPQEIDDIIFAISILTAATVQLLRASKLLLGRRRELLLQPVPARPITISLMVA